MKYLLITEARQVNGTTATGGRTGAAAFAQRLVQLGNAFLLVHLDRSIGANALAGATAGTEVAVDARDRPFCLDRLLVENRKRAGGGGLGLHDAFLKIFRSVRQAAHKHAVGSEIHRSQFHVRFKEETLFVERHLEQKGVTYLNLEPLKIGTAPLLEIVAVVDFGRWLMVKAGNMKLTFDKRSGEIVNTSGGGCPDIPYLHAEMVGRLLNEAPRPKQIGFTLCALMLEQALEEALRLWQEGER